VTAAALLGGLASTGPVLAGSGPPTLSDPLPGADRLPNGWGLHPAGTQVLTNRATTGVAVSPNGKDVYATTSGIFEEAVVHIDAASLVPVPTLVSDAFQDPASDAAGNVWASGGPADAVWQFKAVGPALVDARQAGAAPGLPNRGIKVTGYPGNMLLAGSRLLVAGTLSVPAATVGAADPGSSCDRSAICSVVNVVDVSNPDATSPTVHAIPVGRDAFGLAWRQSSSTVYVSNFADQTNTARSSASAPTGTVSVVRLNADGTGSEVQVVPVGLGPSGIALSPDGSTLAVADSGSDQLSVLTLAKTTGLVTKVRTLSLSAAPGEPLGTSPLAATFSRDGRFLFVALAGINALEVFSVSAGSVAPIPQVVGTTYLGRTVSDVRVPATYIPTGWYPDSVAVGPTPGATTDRLYVANLRGNGAGPGFYGQLEPLVGSSTEGSVSVIDLPQSTTGVSEAFNRWTAQTVTNDELAPLFDRSLVPTDPASNACVAAPVGAGATALSDLLCEAQQKRIDPHSLHVVIIEAENKTFDSYFGDTQPTLTNANANPAFAEYGAAVTANQHALAESYSVDDNFWNEGAESSVLGHSWLSGGYTTVDNELTWGMDYDQGLRGSRAGGQYGPDDLSSASPTGFSLSGPSNAEVSAQEQVMLAPRNLLTDEAYAAGLSVRLLGTDSRPGDPVVAAGDQVPQNLWGESGSDVSSDLAWPDVDRAAMFLHGTTTSHAWDVLDGPAPPAEFGKKISFTAADYQKFTLDAWDAGYRSCISSGSPDSLCQRSMPNLTYMQLPENHTYVVSNVLNPMDPTPQSMVADNDYAIGEIVQGLSHSPFWKNTIVLVTEDDNQFTGDHVDIHRTFVLTAGGMARQLGKQGLVATQVGSFPSIDKTTEILLGLPPMTLFDARAVPLQQVVADTTGASNEPYSATYPAVPFLSGRVELP
jgi:DNA-binding beta-propeller fold protein YncE